MPIAVWLAVFLAWMGSEKRAREAALLAFTAVSVAVLVFSELLSPFHALRLWWLVLLWAALLLAVSVACRTRIVRGWRRVRSASLPPWTVWEWLTAGILVAFGLGTLASALLYRIINHDSLTYHMPRVFFWFQNHSVARYPTPEGRQLFASPFAEYFILHLKILVGGADRLSNIVQWLSYVFSILAVSLVTLRLGAGRRGQQVAAVTAAVTPMMLLQASTTQNDLTCALWSVASIYWIVSYIYRKPEGRTETAWWVVALSVSLALATQTKPPAYIVCAPFLVWLAVVAIRRDGLRSAVTAAAAVLAIVLALNASWYVDNARLLNGDLLGMSAPGGNANLLIRDRNPEAMVTNALKNVSMMLGTPHDGVNDWIENMHRSVIVMYGGDPENPRTIDANVRGTYQIDARVLYHDVGPSPMTALLIAVSAVIVLALGRLTSKTSRWYLLCAGASLFLTAGLIGYSAFVNRTQLGALLALVPVVGVAADALEQDGRRFWRWALYTLLGIAVAWGAAAMLFNSTNRLVSPSLVPFSIGNRDLGYWNTAYEDLGFREHAPQFEEPYKTISAIVHRNGYERVGIDSKALNVPIFPLLPLLADRQVAYVNNTLLKDKIAAAPFSPQAIIEIVPADQFSGASSANGHQGRLLYGPARVTDLVITLREVP